MKKDIHPEYVETQVTCTCGNTFTTRSTATVRRPPRRRLLATATRSTPASRRSSTPAAASPASRPATPRRHRPRRPRASSSFRAPAPHCAGGRRSSLVHAVRASPTGGTCVRGRRGAARRARRARDRRSPTPASTPTRRLATQAEPALRRALGDRRAPRRDWQQLGDDIEAARELAAEDESFAAEAERARQPVGRRPRSGCATCWCRATPADAKDALLEVKSGEGGEESALFAGDLLRMYTRYAERRGWSDRDPRRHRVRPRRLQVGDRRGQGQGHAGAGRGAVRPAQVRGRRAPGAAGAGHRVARGGCTPPPPACW